MFAVGAVSEYLGDQLRRHGDGRPQDTRDSVPVQSSYLVSFQHETLFAIDPHFTLDVLMGPACDPSVTFEVCKELRDLDETLSIELIFVPGGPMPEEQRHLGAEVPVTAITPSDSRKAIVTVGRFFSCQKSVDL